VSAYPAICGHQRVEIAESGMLPPGRARISKSPDDRLRWNHRKHDVDRAGFPPQRHDEGGLDCASKHVGGPSSTSFSRHTIEKGGVAPAQRQSIRKFPPFAISRARGGHLPQRGGVGCPTGSSARLPISTRGGEVQSAKAVAQSDARGASRAAIPARTRAAFHDRQPPGAVPTSRLQA